MIAVNDLVRLKRSHVKLLRKKYPQYKVCVGILKVIDCYFTNDNRMVIVDKPLLSNKSALKPPLLLNALKDKCFVSHRKHKIKPSGYDLTIINLKNRLLRCK